MKPTEHATNTSGTQPYIYVYETDRTCYKHTRHSTIYIYIWNQQDMLQTHQALNQIYIYIWNRQDMLQTHQTLNHIYIWNRQDMLQTHQALNHICIWNRQDMLQTHQALNHVKIWYWERLITSFITVQSYDVHKSILSIILQGIYGAAYSANPFLFDNTCTLYYHLDQIGSMIDLPLFRVRSLNNGMCCDSFYILWCVSFLFPNVQFW